MKEPTFGGSAFPFPEKNDGVFEYSGSDGMDMIQYYTGQALSGILSRPDLRVLDELPFYEEDDKRWTAENDRIDNIIDNITMAALKIGRGMVKQIEDVGY